MQECACHRREDAWNGKPYRNCQDAKRKHQILLDGPHRLPGETQQVGELGQVIGQERDLRYFNGNIRATQPHRHTHIGCRERRPIVHPVTHKGDTLPLGLELLDNCER